MAELRSLLSRVVDEFPGVPEALALRALSDSAREFCTRTFAWREDLDDIPLVLGQVEYDIAPATGVRVASILGVWLDGEKLHPLMTEYRNLVSEARGELPDGYFQSGPDTLELVHAPAAAGKLKVRAALTLGVGALVSVPETLVQDYGESVAAGAKMRLARQGGQVWFNPNLVPLYAGPYYADINAAKSKINSALGAAQGQVEFRRV